jgi:hypothetical protein
MVDQKQTFSGTDIVNLFITQLCQPPSPADKVPARRLPQKENGWSFPWKSVKIQRIPAGNPLERSCGQHPSPNGAP